MQENHVSIKLPVADMSWRGIADKHQKKYGRNFVACHEPEERTYIIDQIIGQFPRFRKGKVKQAIESACQALPTPRAREEFFTCLESKLNSAPTLKGPESGPYEKGRGKANHKIQ